MQHLRKRYKRDTLETEWPSVEEPYAKTFKPEAISQDANAREISRRGHPRHKSPHHKPCDGNSSLGHRAALTQSGGGALRGQRVYVYSASWCQTCRQLRTFLEHNNIRYTLLDATTPRVQANMISRFGNLSVPRTLIGRSVVSGLDPTAIKQLCR